MLALTLLLSLVPAQIGAPRGVHLLDDAPLLAQVDPPMVPSEAPASEAMVSAEQLQVDLDALRRQRPGLGGGITLISIGGGAALMGALYMALSGAISANPLFIIGAVAVGLGVPMIAIGVWLLYNRIQERNRIDEETAALKKQLQLRRSLQQQRPYSPPPPQLDIPPPQVRGPDTSLLLARF